MLATDLEWPDYSSVPAPANVETLLAVASGMVRTYVGWTISLETVVDRVLDTDGSAVLMLPTLQLSAVAEIVLYDDVLIVDDDYVWSDKGIIERRPRGLQWPKDLRSVTISYTHGYDPVPAEIKAIVVGIAAKAADAPAGGVVEEQVGGIRVRYAESTSLIRLDRPEMNVLDRYRL